MRAAEPDTNAKLRRQLDAKREERSNAVERLKRAAAKVSAGCEAPGMSKVDHDEAPLTNAMSDSWLPAVDRIQRCRVKTKQSREARSEGIRAFKKTSMAVVQTMRRTVRLDPPSDSNGNGVSAAV